MFGLSDCLRSGSVVGLIICRVLLTKKQELTKFFWQFQDVAEAISCCKGLLVSVTIHWLVRYDKVRCG